MTEPAQKPFRIAIAQLPITGDAHQNGERVRAEMTTAAKQHARLIQFPEGMLTGYAKNPIMDWSEVDWGVVKAELQRICELAAKLKIWVVLGSAHPLTPPHWPHNSLYVISDTGELVNRYDKRVCSYTETKGFYTPGTAPIIFDVDGFRFGLMICVEINFPDLFKEYEQLGVDCLLLSAYPEAEIFFTKTRAHAAIYNYWIGLSSPTDRADMMMSALIDPEGNIAKQIQDKEGTITTVMDKTDPALDIPLNKARPWRRAVNSGEFHKAHLVDDPRSTNRTMY